MKIVEVQGVKKYYGEQNNVVRALNGVSFTINQGEFVSIVGQSGSGKSTLLNIIGGLDKPSEGDVIVNNVNINALATDKQIAFRRRNIGFVFQNYSLMPELSVYNNVILPVSFGRKSRIDREYIDKLLLDLGIWEKKNSYPFELSGGQQQRVAIARALANKPAVVLADEPTGNLDSKTTDDVMRLLKKCCKEYSQTIVMVTHNDRLAELCDKSIRICDGKNVEMN